MSYGGTTTPMSSERSTNVHRPLKPSVPSSRTPRPPITPRVAGTNNAPASPRPTATRTPSNIRSEPPTPRVKGTTTPINAALANGNVTPRSSARVSRVESTPSTPKSNSGTPTATHPRSAVVAANGPGVKSGVGISSGVQARAGVGRPRSLISDNGSGVQMDQPSVRSPGNTQSMDSGMFFHASDAPKHVETTQKKPEVKKPAAFFYADGQQEAGAPSPVLSAVSEQKSTGPWIRPEMVASPPRSPPILSPGLSALSIASPFFAPAPNAIGSVQRSPSPTKENIHLSYRKGASQIFGTRPTASPRSTGSSADIPLVGTTSERRISQDVSAAALLRHQKSPSLSSIDSGSSPLSRRRSATTADPEPSSSPLATEVKAATFPRSPSIPTEIPSIDTSLEASAAKSPLDGPLSPTKGVSDFAAEARRERKVLDLEISNSSLLAINASLEREVRRQKAELKRFRRLSRAGRFSLAPGERLNSRVSDGLSVVGEEDEDDDGESMFGPASGLSELYDDMSDDDDDESLASSAEPLSPSGQSSRERDRLAKDEKRLQVDLAKHKELLVQSQAMNQSIKRCTYATEDMIREGRKALEYYVRVSDVKLGGRVLSSHEDDEDFGQEIEVADDEHREDDADQATGFLDVWGGVGRPSFESSEGGDRDSGIEVDRQPFKAAVPLGYIAGNIADSGRPPGDEDSAEQMRSLSSS